MTKDTECQCYAYHRPIYASINCECECHLEQEMIWVEGHFGLKPFTVGV